MEIEFYSADGKPYSVKDYEFKISMQHEKIGEITVGGLGAGSTLQYDCFGMKFCYKDGTKYFINYSWFDKH